MIDLTFPDGAVRSYEQGVTGRTIAEGLSKSLAKKAAMIRLNGDLYDLDRPIEGHGTIEILLRDAPEMLEVIRHDAAHLLAQAVQELFPGTQVTIGPSIEDGFYYDFARAEPFSLDDLPKIEKKMKELVDRDEKIVREVWDRNEAIAHFESIGENYKAEIIRDLPGTETITVYRHGDNWKDLCRGPHFPSSKFVGKAFKLTKLAGAYWRGDQNNAQLQRIYGTAWASEEDLQAYLTRIEEAEKRDHRKIGRQMDLFHMQEEGRGMVFWHPKGWTLWQTLEAYIRRKLDKAGYVEVRTPQVLDSTFWQKSGHWDKYRANMFVCETVEGETLAVKPMSCPGHVQVFNVGLRSYRELPIRMGEFGSCHRYEPSGSLHGLMRVRAFTQDDGHIFCREDQVVSEVSDFVTLTQQVYADLGFEVDEIALSTRPAPDVRAGTDEQWDQSEAMLLDASRKAGVEPRIAPGDGAFYGPKLEFIVRDAIGRTWTCGTIQLDMVLPERLSAEYVAEDGSRRRPIMLHRAIFGSFERFIGITIENYAGKFPLWLAPLQVMVAPITSDTNDYAQQVAQKLRNAGIRVDTDLRNEKINYKIREHSLAKVPVIAVIGRKEAETGEVALRYLGQDGQSILSLDEAVRVLTTGAAPPDL
ncbi:threonine--tRNA ligase [Asticcacaulis tiandongensis]|uniref:threonine--tRNA ligase n=1 Tax=Asticcacaulis tiandongensis TaxID=2565365 RepID=UPI001128674C|nr:threonine--tRNA ligase [Asticcacaulis tiandongensis]